MEKNTEFLRANQFVQFTDVPVFLTGKAGTGKTTFLKHVVGTTNKKTIVAAPTGVAAMNAGGVTLHSLFQLPFGVFLPTRNSPPIPVNCDWRNQANYFQKMRLSRSKRELLKKLELLIIDEVSMVRVDLLDAIDYVLRSVRKRRNEPFGGVQVLLIGDLRQLSPVARDNEWSVLKEYYASPYFFDAAVFQKLKWAKIELKKVYRQSDERFVALLNRLRNNQISKEDVELLDRKYLPNFSPDKDDQYITLCSHNYKADRINQHELDLLPGKFYSFKAVVEDDFPENAYPTDFELRLKIGAQVMFTRNDSGEDRKYFNGKIGILEEVFDDSLRIFCPSDNTHINVERQVWKNIRYNVNPETNQIEEDLLGTFTQYPLRLSWAITIHKSQGLTFERAIVDAGDSFAPGQVYVALSRLTSLDGLVLKSKIPADRVSIDASVTHFLDQFPDEKDLLSLYAESKEAFLRKVFLNSFDLKELSVEWTAFLESLPKKKLKNKEEVFALSQEVKNNFTELYNVAVKFQLYLDERWIKGQNPNSALINRTYDAIRFFEKKIKDEIVTKTRKVLNQVSTKVLQEEVFYLFQSMEEKLHLLKKLFSMLQALESSNGVEEALEKGSQTEMEYSKKSELLGKDESQTDTSSKKAKKKPKPEKGETYKITLDLIEKGLSVEEVAKERGLVVSTIESHVVKLILDNKLPKKLLIDDETEQQILKAYNEHKEATRSMLKGVLPEEITYSQIGYVMKAFPKEEVSA
jgi:hypothetical protein